MTKDRVFAEFKAYWQIADESLGKATKEQLSTSPIVSPLTPSVHVIAVCSPQGALSHPPHVDEQDQHDRRDDREDDEREDERQGQEKDSRH